MKYASIILCFILAFAGYLMSANKKDSKYVLIALGFTLTADIFLLFTTDDFAGVFFFCLVQLTYLKRYNEKFLKFGLVAAVTFICAFFILPFDATYMISGLYALLIVSTFASTFTTKIPKINVKLAQFGMLLFILCDIHVALYNVLPRDHWYYQIVMVAMWFFYLPSQVLIALSASHYSRH